MGSTLHRLRIGASETAGAEGGSRRSLGRPPQPVVDRAAEVALRRTLGEDHVHPRGVEPPQRGEQIRRRLGEIAGFGQRPRASHGSPGAPRDAKRSTPTRASPRAAARARLGIDAVAQPQRRGRGVVFFEHAGRRFAAPHPPAMRGRPTRRRPAARARFRSLRRRRRRGGARARRPGSVQLTTVDSTPVSHGPPSSTMATASPSSSTTCSGRVGLMRPKRLADGAARGTPADSIRARGDGVARHTQGDAGQTGGDEVADGVDRGVGGVVGLAACVCGSRRLFTTRVSGPGQKAAASRAAASGQRAAYRRA